ncbi:unnamed protein product [Pylaiella littoralis]
MFVLRVSTHARKNSQIRSLWRSVVARPCHIASTASLAANPPRRPFPPSLLSSRNEAGATRDTPETHERHKRLCAVQNRQLRGGVESCSAFLLVCTPVGLNRLFHAVYNRQLRGGVELGSVSGQTSARYVPIAKNRASIVHSGFKSFFLIRVRFQFRCRRSGG